MMSARISVLVTAIALTSATAATAAESSQVTDAASAIVAAKSYTRARCTIETTCDFKARREGKLWNVMVQFRRKRPGQKPQSHPDGYILLYFNSDGQLVRRVEGQ